MVKKTTKLTYFDVEIGVNAKNIVKQLAQKEFDERRSCQRSEVDQYIKTICELQRAVKSLKSQIDRIESILTIK